MKNIIKPQKMRLFFNYISACLSNPDLCAVRSRSNSAESAIIRQQIDKAASIALASSKWHTLLTPAQKAFCMNKNLVNHFFSVLIDISLRMSVYNPHWLRCNWMASSKLCCLSPPLSLSAPTRQLQFMTYLTILLSPCSTLYCRGENRSHTPTQTDVPIPTVLYFRFHSKRARNGSYQHELLSVSCFLTIMRLVWSYWNGKRAYISLYI